MKRQPIDLYTGPTTLAIDVSAHQGVIDWPTVGRSKALLGGRPQGRPRLAIVRTSDGVQPCSNSRPDPHAVRNLRGAHEAGLRCAVYHFVHAHHDPCAQAALVLEVIAEAGVPVAFVALDLEGQSDDVATREEESGGWWRPPGATAVDTHEVLLGCEMMWRELARHGHSVLIYSGVAWHWQVAQVAQRVIKAQHFGDLPLWTPYYTSSPHPRLPVDRNGDPAPWSKWVLWQYSSQGLIAGIDGNVGLNRFRGDSAALERWCERLSVLGRLHELLHATTSVQVSVGTGVLRGWRSELREEIQPVVTALIVARLQLAKMVCEPS